MIYDPVLRVYGCDHGVRTGPRLVPPDPAKAYRCTTTVARMDGHECRVNRLTGDVYDRCGETLSYVGRSCGDDDADVCAWMAWMSWRCEP